MAEPDHNQRGERYARALIAAMREVLAEVDDEQAELLLETADFWLQLGLVAGVERPTEARRLLDAVASDTAERQELLADADELLRDSLP